MIELQQNTYFIMSIQNIINEHYCGKALKAGHIENRINLKGFCVFEFVYNFVHDIVVSDESIAIIDSISPIRDII